MKLRKIGKTSNASFKITKLVSPFLLQSRFKKLLFSRKWLCGRSNTGKITVFTKGHRVKKLSPYINYRFRTKSLFFIGGLNYTSFYKKISVIVFTSTGMTSYLPARVNDNFFFLSKLQSMSMSRPQFYKDLLHFKPFIKVNEVPFMLIQQKKNSKISFVELKPLQGSLYARSLGSSASIIKLDTRTGFSLVKLPSGVKKVFSAFSLSSDGPANAGFLKNQQINTKSGF